MEREISCPKCGGDNLHQYAVQAHHFGTVVTQFVRFEEPVICVDKCEGENPSPRRQGLRIGFWCENQCDVPDLAIYQHKGQTIMEWMEHTVFWEADNLLKVEMKWET